MNISKHGEIYICQVLLEISMNCLIKPLQHPHGKGRDIYFYALSIVTTKETER